MKARNLVFNALLKVENDGYSTIILSSILKEANNNNFAFITALFYGVIERKYTLDYVLNKYLDKGIKSLKTEILTYLRMGLYEALYMNTPIYAITNEYVSLVKKSKFNNSSGLINAILRKAGQYDLKYLINKDDTIKFSVNKDVLECVYNAISEEKGKEFFENSLLPAPVFVRINNLDNNFVIPNNFEATDIKNVYRVNGFNANDPDHINGKYFVQDISAGNSVILASPKENDEILDLCSAPGGKSFTSYLLTNGKAKITACDIYEQRVNLIKQNAERLGFNISTVINDATVFNNSLGLYDLVICDVPCTGFGVIRRKPEIKYKSIDEIKSIKDLQIKIVDNAVRYVKNGGKLLYSTCTLNNAENREMVDYILLNNKDFYLETEKTMLPNELNGDGFYAAVLRKR